MDAKQIVAEAWEAVRAAELPEHLQITAFEHAVRLVELGQQGTQGEVKEESRKGPKTTQRTNRSPQPKEEPEDPSGAAVNADDFFDKFAQESGVDVDTLHALYSVLDGKVRIGLTRRKLGTSEAEKNRTVAALMVSASWYASGRASLTIGEVREAAKAAGYEPSRNLTKHLEGVPGTQAVGNGAERAIRVQGAKIDDAFAALVERLTGA